MSNRRMARWVANSLGFFWLPCPLCGQEFGGHEWRPNNGHASDIPDPASGPSHGLGICPACTAAGKGCYAQAAATDGWISHGCEQTRKGLVERLGETEAANVLASFEHRQEGQ